MKILLYLFINHSYVSSSICTASNGEIKSGCLTIQDL